MLQTVDTPKTEADTLASRPLIDSFGRRIDYARISVTDRCDLRCRYCMAEEMVFVPHRDVLTFEEIEQLADALIARGVRRIRLTGGEPLVRRHIATLIDSLGSRIGHGLDELTLTTNGTQLDRFAQRLHDAGVRRVNVSLDTLDPDRFHTITRRGNLERVLAGIRAAKDAGLSVKINMVALAGLNDVEIPAMLRWCAAEGFDLTLIETMPMGSIDEDRSDRYLPLDSVLQELGETFPLAPSDHRSAGPARYYRLEGTNTRLGLITPLTQNFCAGCNRIRIAATGTVFGCLGQEQKIELRDVLREGGPQALDRLLDEVMRRKPRGHDFDIEDAAPAVPRHMSATGG